MELLTFNLDSPDPTQPGTFEIQDIIENFESLIWTERYYGDSECLVTFPIDLNILRKLPLDMFIGIEESDELLMVDTINIEENRLKVKGISVLTWLNNRFVRTSKNHKVRTTKMNGPPGQILWELLDGAVGLDSVYLNPDATDIPQKYLDKLKIPEIGLKDFDISDDPVTLKVSFANLYDEMRKIAETYKIGMKMFFQPKLDPTADVPLLFRSYKGLNKTHTQDPSDVQNPIVRFSAELNSLNNLRQIMSSAIYKTLAFAFASNIGYDLGSETGANAGIAFVGDPDDPNIGSGFKCRALQVFADDIRGYDSPTTEEKNDLLAMLANDAQKGLAKSILIQAVDGDISPTNMFIYGRDYSLGDFVEIEGVDGVTSVTQVTEHIISEEATGDTGYVTLGTNAADVSV
jgi:hypothetical protein